MRAITGIATATAAFVGFASDGPAGTPVEIASLADFEAGFGKVSAAQPLSSAVAEFFLNGGSKAVIVRVASGPKARKADLIDALQALTSVQERPGLLVMPDAAYLSEKDAAELAKAATSFAEAHGTFHIADIPAVVAGKGHDAAVRWASTALRSRDMAVYHPWLVAASQGRKNRKTPRPPSGVVAGIYARLDQTRGVWKAPAGEDATAIEVAGLAQKVSSGDAEKLRDAAINPIVSIRGRGVALWGALTRAADGDAEWKYVNVRRFLLFLEGSIEEGLSWAVFEPNGEGLWAEIRLEISAFLYTAWRAGALVGARPDEAYFVRCDRTTMTQNDIDNGRIIAEIGVAPLKPAEFVIFRIGLTAAQEP
jgi:phage tail sheath protein FI